MYTSAPRALVQELFLFPMEMLDAMSDEDRAALAEVQMGEIGPEDLIEMNSGTLQKS